MTGHTRGRPPPTAPTPPPKLRPLTVADGEQLADPGHRQPEPFRAADEQQPVHVGRPVPALFSSGPLRDRQQAFSFVYRTMPAGTPVRKASCPTVNWPAAWRFRNHCGMALELGYRR
jgi:hypothetical protein